MEECKSMSIPMGKKEKLVYCISKNQLINIFTKSFHVGHFETLRDKLGVCVAQI